MQIVNQQSPGNHPGAQSGVKTMLGQCDYCDNGCDRCKPDTDSDYCDSRTELARVNALRHALVAMGEAANNMDGPPLTHGSTGMSMDKAQELYIATKRALHAEAALQADSNKRARIRELADKEQQLATLQKQIEGLRNVIK